MCWWKFPTSCHGFGSTGSRLGVGVGRVSMPEVDESKLGWEIYTLNFKLTCFLPTLLYLHWVHRVNLLFQRPVPLLTSIPQAIAPSGSPTQHSCCLLCSSLAHHLPARSRSSATDLYCHSSLCLSISNEGSAPPSHGLQSPSSYIPPAFPLSHPPDCSFKVINKGSDVKSTCAHPIRPLSTIWNDGQPHCWRSALSWPQ